ncbi:DinB family protein [Chitinophaga ginsengisoli]|uniref:DinB family protein n=1 Tax=Chitinophaga ginsengisoli TaxID=363837 RepID=A0A2P8GMT0_9BACT|nr:DinB family protein [Chitinophaga ginsengisoli]PSL35272.1 DinB family protein [Chitinophaga ginsengisoli]
MSAKIETPDLLKALHLQMDDLLKTANEQFVNAPQQILLRQPAPEKWSVAQCLDHLNAYSRFYVPAMEKAIQSGLTSSLPPAATFKSGWLGNYFTKMMEPKTNGQPGMKMQAPKAYRPMSDLDAGKVVSEFIEWQQKTKALLDQAQYVNLQSLKIPTTLGNWLKFSLGDTFRFVIAHERRHMAQALRAKA